MYCVYLTVYFGDKLPRRYIGYTKTKRIYQGYNGSIKSKKYKAIYAREQIENKHLFKTKILSLHSSREEAIKEELRIQIKYNVVKSNKYMNMALATINGCFGLDNSGYNHPMYNKSHTAETKKRISDLIKKQYETGGRISPFVSIDFSGEKNPFYGKTHSEETKKKMRKPKRYVPKFKCLYCEVIMDAGNLKQHNMRKHVDKSSVHLKFSMV